jgi:hypothetical protein
VALPCLTTRACRGPASIRGRDARWRRGGGARGRRDACRGDGAGSAAHGEVKVGTGPASPGERTAGRRVDSPDGTKRKGGASARRQAGTVLLQLAGRIEVGERSATPSRTKVERGVPRLGCIGAEHRGARCRTRRSQPEETNHSRRPAPSVLPPGCGRAAGLPFLCPGVAGIACRQCLDSLGGQAARCPRWWRC